MTTGADTGAAPAKAVSKTKKATKDMLIPPIAIERFVLRIVGDTPLICHAWSQKAKQQILDKQMGKPQGKKETRDPDADYEAAFYRLPDGTPAFPTLAFKKAAVDAARQLGPALKMTFLRGTFHTVGNLVAVEGIPHRRDDMVSIGIDTADIRFRPEYDTWAVNLEVRLNTNALTLEQLVHLFNQAGFSCGVGEWRPERNGTNGMFHVEGVQALGSEVPVFVTPAQEETP